MELAKAFIKNLQTKKQLKGKKLVKSEGYLARLLTRIIDNVEVTLKNVHVRYEDGRSRFSLGVTLN